jgi:hypothetical protein
MEQDGGLAVPSFAEDEQRAIGRERDSRLLRGVERDIDERRRATLLGGRAGDEDRSAVRVHRASKPEVQRRRNLPFARELRDS